MKQWKTNSNLEQARQIDIVTFLSNNGYLPVKINRQDYWYLSPLRGEKTASFKVNRSMNRWYDHGLGKGGNFLDFAILYYKCSPKEVFNQIRTGVNYAISSRLVISEDEAPIIKIVQTSSISSPALLYYLKVRRISLPTAAPYCKEVRYRLGEKIYYSIGFENDRGGYELRNPYFKNSSSPKSITTFKNGAQQIAVFEGFFDFLSFLEMAATNQPNEFDFCVLNSLALFEKTIPFLETYTSINLFLDNDTAGQNCSRKALMRNHKYADQSTLYTGYKDLNDWLINIGKRPMN